MELVIHPAKPSDYAALLLLFDQIDSLHRDNLPEIFKKPEGNPREEDYFLGLLSQPDIRFLIAEENGQIIGFVHIILRDTPPIPIFAQRRIAVVDSAVVRVEYRGKGVGRQLMEAAHDWAVKQGAESIELTVYEFNEAAIAFYKRLGYKMLSHRMQKSLS